MSIHLFKTAKKLVTGINASEKLVEYIQQLNMTRVLILTDKGVLNSPAVNKIEKNLIENSISYQIESSISHKKLFPIPSINPINFLISVFFLQIFLVRYLLN